MNTFLIIGAGAIGATTAQRLADEGHQVRLVSRRGTGPVHDAIELVAADATNEAAMTALAKGAGAIFNCANPAYHRWATDWPPIANSLLHAAETSGADLVTLSNLYVYGAPHGPMTPHDPLDARYEKAQVRVTMWRDALAANDAGRLRATEVRASDFIGPGAQSALGDRIIPRVLGAKKCWVLGDVDAPHSWTYTDDVARTLIACAHSDATWGRAWHVPTNPPRSSREAVNDLAAAAGVGPIQVAPIPLPVLRLVGLFDATVRELPTTLYQFNAPFVIDDTETRSTLALEPTPWADALRATVRAKGVADHRTA